MSILHASWANSYYYELIGYTKAAYEARFQNQCDRYFETNPEGWKLLTEKIESSLAKGEKGYSVYLPMVYPDGSKFWIKRRLSLRMNISADTELPIPL